MTPLVACLMPTMASRWPFWPLAIECFRRQTYGSRVLLILADEGTEIVKRAPGDEVKAKTYPRGASLGEKWNALHSWADSLGAQYCTAWPDDDWQSPKSLQMRMDAIGGNDRVGCKLQLFVELTPDLEAEVDEHFYRTPGRGLELHGGFSWTVSTISHLYKTRLGVEYPSPHVTGGEDWAFQEQLYAANLRLMPDRFAFEQVCTRHAGNTWESDTPGQIGCGKSLGELLGDMAPGYLLAAGRTKEEAELWRKRK